MKKGQWLGEKRILHESELTFPKRGIKVCAIVNEKTLFREETMRIMNRLRQFESGKKQSRN